MNLKNMNALKLNSLIETDEQKNKLFHLKF